MLEVPVAYIVESKNLSRNKSVWVIAAAIFCISALLIFNSGWLFDFVVSLTTEYSQPLLGLILCIFAGWVWRRNEILTEIKNGNENAEHSLFWRIWPWYVKFVCPVIIIIMFVRSLI